MFCIPQCKRLFFGVLIVLVSGLMSNAAEEGFVDLFNGKDFTGWQQHGGTAQYTIEEGGIVVGTSVPNTGNSFLCTQKDYGDFILELDFKVDESLNSGIQIRSQVFEKETTIKLPNEKGVLEEKKIPADRVHGYQVEIDPSKRAWSAGIYDEARRGWLYNLEGDNNKAAREAFKHNEWNHVRIEAIGDTIKTWLNGVAAANLKDDMTLSGLIALQVHGVGDNAQKVGKQIRWKNIRIKEIKK